MLSLHSPGGWDWRLPPPQLLTEEEDLPHGLLHDHHLSVSPEDLKGLLHA